MQDSNGIEERVNERGLFAVRARSVVYLLMKEEEADLECERKKQGKTFVFGKTRGIGMK